METPITEVVRLTGITSRTLRHYDAIGLLTPSSVEASGFRYYDDAAIRRLQRILLLRELGLSLETIAQVLDQNHDEEQALRTHIGWLQNEKQRINRQIKAVQATLDAVAKGETIMATQALDGFNHTKYGEEVKERWGKTAYEAGNEFFVSDSFSAVRQAGDDLLLDWRAAAEAGIDPNSPEAQALATRQVEWLSSVPGTPGYGSHPVREYIESLAEMYVADSRFANAYGGEKNAVIVRDSLLAFVERNL